MDMGTKLNALYKKTLEKGDKVLYYDRVMENFYFKYDISVEYTMEDLDNMRKELADWKRVLNVYQNNLWSLRDELEIKVSSVGYHAGRTGNRQRRGKHA